MNRWIAWPLLVSLMLQTLVAGGVPFGGSMVLCLSGEDHASHDAASMTDASEPATCGSGCGHHAQVPTPTLQPPHEHQCPCLDITLRSIESRLRDQDALPDAPAPVVTLAIVMPLADTAGSPPRVARLHDARPPPVDPALACLRTIRLLT